MLDIHGRENATDIGGGVWISPTSWKPDRELNPQYADIPDVERLGLMFFHGDCAGSIMFDSEAARRVFPDHPRWTVEQEDPLTLAPSILCKLCGVHGFIREGRWVSA